uniref:Putative membrane protein mmpL7 n=2 Tax=Lygus hesperus TaxID=30085 RepID=A0A0A9YRJ0_LYGHE
MSNPFSKMEGLFNQKDGKRSAKDKLARMCVQEYTSDNTRALSLAYMEEVVNNNGNLMTSAAAAALTSHPCAPPPKKNKMLTSSSESSSKNALKVSDLLLCPDEEFDVHVNVTRRTIKKIFDAVKMEHKDFQYNDFLLLIWYLSCRNNSEREAAAVFEIQSEEEVHSRLVDTSCKLSWLRGSAKMRLPDDEYDEDEIVECFKRRTELPNVLGALGVMRLECLDGSWINVLAIVDHERYFRHLSLSDSSHVVHDVVRNSEIYDRLCQDHPKHYTFLCPAEGYPSLPQLLPGLRDDEITLFDEMPDFDLRHNDVVSYVRTAIKEAVSRFPKLEALQTATPEIVEAAFMLHNLCNQLRDTSIYNYYADDLPYSFSR